MIKETLSKAIEGLDLTEEECTAAMMEIMEGKATDAQIAAFLVALRVKGETVDEIVAGAKVMREKVSRVSVDDVPVLIDTCGTGGDGAETFNVSTIAALIAAAGGVSVAKHGNRSVSSSSGSADVLKTLGVNIEKQPDEAAQSIRSVNFGFLFAPLYHGAMKYAIGPRREMGVRTIFNVLGPLTNPAGVRRQVMGVYSEALVEPIARVLLRLDADKAMVVHSEDGLDELSPAAPTKVAEASEGDVKSTVVSPSDLGLEAGPLDDMKVGSAEESAGLIRKVLAGEKGTARTAALMNAAAALYVAGVADTLAAGAAKAAELVDTGAAAKHLDAIIAAG
jgi:anthranilate phosphoribosyltransferase